MVVFDTSTIVLALDPSAKPPTDENGQVVTNCKERVEHLLDTINNPAPRARGIRCPSQDLI